MLTIGFSIYHHGCPASQSTERFPDVSLKVLDTRAHDGNRASALLYGRASREENLRKFLGYWKNHKAVTGLRALDRAQAGIIFEVALRPSIGWVTKAILDNNAFFIDSVISERGMEKWNIFVNESNKAALFSQLDEIGVVKINRISKLEFNSSGISSRLSPLAHLSPRQLEVLKAAVEEGYFDCPRSVDSRELAQMVGIAQSTLLEHLRKAQLKMLRHILTEPELSH